MMYQYKPSILKNHLLKGSFFAQHDNRDSQFSCGDAANMLYTLHVFHYIDIQNVSYQLRFKRLRAYFSKSSNMLHVSKGKKNISVVMLHTFVVLFIVIFVCNKN
ncbi:hypothetical protein Ddc_23271 [Ditylenchus destructor]|nr:hypothetical protein Ddc_23271 [Ditylenchus destructor]